MAAPFRTSVVEQWIDYNGHLNEGYYAVIFGMASDDLLEQLGFNEAYRRDEAGTFYTAESHIRFLNEVNLGDELSIELCVLGVDAKRMHLWHEMYRATDGILAATHESMLLHVDTTEVRVTPMAQPLYESAVAELRTGEAPDGAGSSVRTLPPIMDVSS